MTILLIIAAIAGAILLITLVGCTKKKPDVPLPTPRKQIPIPAWVTSPETIYHYVVKVLPSDGGDDIDTFGYTDYRPTPAEFFMKEIPNCPLPRLIRKFPGTRAKPGNENVIVTAGPFQGDCDVYAVLNAYIASTLNLKSHYVEIQMGTTRAHAIAYAEIDGKIVVFDVMLPPREYADLEAWRLNRYPSWRIRKNEEIGQFLSNLLAQEVRGNRHVEYLPADHPAWVKYG